jgi:hypothetical protein
MSRDPVSCRTAVATAQNFTLLRTEQMRLSEQTASLLGEVNSNASSDLWRLQTWLLIFQPGRVHTPCSQKVFYASAAPATWQRAITAVVVSMEAREV